MLKYYLKIVAMIELLFTGLFIVLYFVLQQGEMILSKAIFTYVECSIIVFFACLVSIFIVEYFD